MKCLHWTANYSPQPKLYGQPKGPCMEDTWYPYQLVGTGPHVLPPPWDTLSIIDRFLSAHVVSHANLQSVGIRWVFLGLWCYLQSTSSIALTHRIQRRSFRQTCASASSLRHSTLLWTSSTAFSLCMSCLLLSYSWLALGVCFSDCGTFCSQLSLWGSSDRHEPLPADPTLLWTSSTAFSVCVSCLLLTYSLLALGGCFLDHGAICSQLPLLHQLIVFRDLSGGHVFPPSPWDTPPCCKHHQLLSLCACCVSCLVTVGWH